MSRRDESPVDRLNRWQREDRAREERGIIIAAYILALVIGIMVTLVLHEVLP